MPQSIAVAVAEPDREVHSVGGIPNDPAAVSKLMRKLGKPAQLRVCYEGRENFCCAKGGVLRKYPRAAESWAWHWVFPSPTLSLDPRSGIRRRRRVQELLGHSDVSTTMIYTHVLSSSAAGTRSPLESLPNASRREI